MAYDLPNFKVTASIQIIDKPHRELINLYDSAPSGLMLFDDDKKKLTDTVDDFKGALVAYESYLHEHRNQLE